MATGLRFPITADDHATSTLKSVSSLAKMTAVGIGASFVAAGVAAKLALAQIALDADRMHSSIVKGTGATGAALDGLVDTAIRVSAQITQGMAGAGAAVSAVNTHFGATGEVLEHVSARVADFARVTDGDVSAAGDRLGQFAGIWELTAEQASASLDTLTGVMQRSNIGGDQLLDMVQQFGPVFANAGLGIDETAITVGRLHQAGVDVTRIGPGINKMLRDAAAEGRDGAEAFAALETELRAAGSDMAALAIAQDAVGAEGAQRLARAVRQGGVTFQFAADDAAAYSGALAQAAEDSLTLGEQVALVRNEIVAAIAPTALKWADKLKDWIADLVKNIKESDAGAKIAKAFEEGGWFSAAKAVIDVGWAALWTGLETTGLQPLKNAVSGALAEFDKVTDGIDDDRIAKFRAAVKKFLADPTADNAQALRAEMLAIGPWLEENMPGLVTRIEEVLGGSYKDSWDKITEPVKGQEGPLKQALKDLKTVIDDELPLVGAAVEKWITGDWAGVLADLGVSLLNGAVLALNAGITAINVSAEAAADVLAIPFNAFVRLANKIPGVNISEIDTSGDVIWDIPHIPLTQLPSTVAAIEEARARRDFRTGLGGAVGSREFFDKFEVPDDLANIHSLESAREHARRTEGRNSRTPGAGFLGIPGLASGGIVTRPTLALVGEDGPEAVVPLDRGPVGGVTIHITVQGSIYGDEDAMGEKLVDALQAWQDRNGSLQTALAAGV